MTEMPTAEAAGVWVLGDRVRVTHRLVRNYHPVGARDARKTWDVEELPEEVEGLVVGVRTLSNGRREWESNDDPFGSASTGYWEYRPTAHFRALLVATDLRRKPFLVLYATKVVGG